MKNIFDAIAGKDTKSFGNLDWKRETYQHLKEVRLAVDKDIDHCRRQLHDN